MLLFCVVFFFKQKTAYEMRISDWSSDVCSSDLPAIEGVNVMFADKMLQQVGASWPVAEKKVDRWRPYFMPLSRLRSEEHTSELQSLMRISYAVFCLKKKKTKRSTANNI